MGTCRRKASATLSSGHWSLLLGKWKFKCHILGAWSWRIQAPEPSLEAVDGGHLKDVHCWSSWQSSVMVKSRNEEGSHSTSVMALSGLRGFTRPRDCFQQHVCSWVDMSKGLGSWARSLMQSSNSPPGAFWGQRTLRVHCQLQKTKVDPRTVGYFWRLDRITAGDPA